jgi:hypothetical protein
MLVKREWVHGLFEKIAVQKVRFLEELAAAFTDHHFY